MTRHVVRVTGVLFVLALAIAGWTSRTTVLAGGQLATADAKSWIGDWLLTVEGRRGPQEQTLSVKDSAGKVVAQLAGGRGGPVDITDVSKAGNDLVLKFKRSFGGNDVDITMTLAMQPDGTLKVAQDANGNATAGTGKKKV